MISKIYSIWVNWLESDLIEIETDINNWLPNFTIVWLPDTSVQESKERIRSALKSSFMPLPPSKITINLAPADIKKSWPSYDLPISIWILNHMWIIEENEYLKNSIFLWELSLDWSLRWISSILPSVIWALERGFKNIFIPYDNYFEASIIEGINIFAVKNIKQIVSFLSWNEEIKNPEKININSILKNIENKYDFSHIIWQTQAKRALEISAAWMHNIILSWPPWSWKTLLAKTFSTILPEMTLDEIIEVSKIYSISWLLTKENPIITKRPFRTIHHTASSISIIWWWRNAKPWEISLAHKWVLFLDEVLEFPKTVLEVLRQPLEDGTISVNRVNSSYNYPAKFILLWAMNPCPCGYATDPDKECVCSLDQIKKYSKKLSWPMIDRIDMMIEVPKVKIEDFAKNKETKEESSFAIFNRVKIARNMQLKRFEKLKITNNSQMSSNQVKEFCKLDKESEALLNSAINSMNLSARSYYKILKLSRTIADLEQSENIKINHIAESLSYRKQED